MAPTGWNFPGTWSVVDRAGILRSVWYEPYYVNRTPDVHVHSCSACSARGPRRRTPSSGTSKRRSATSTFPTRSCTASRRDSVMGLVVEARETRAGVGAFRDHAGRRVGSRAWLDRPSGASTELRDPGLLQPSSPTSRRPSAGAWPRSSSLSTREAGRVPGGRAPRATPGPADRPADRRALARRDAADGAALRTVAPDRLHVGLQQNGARGGAAARHRLGPHMDSVVGANDDGLRGAAQTCFMTSLSVAVARAIVVSAAP